jgi:hypothetical protein
MESLMVWVKRIALFLIFAVITFFGCTPLFLAYASPKASPSLAGPAISVGFIFLLDVFVLWVLSKIGGPLKAEVKASIKKFGGSVWITGAGIVGCFLAIAMIGIAGIYLLAK